MNTQHAELVIPATLSEVHRVLLDALALADWNPAFQSIDGPPQPAPGVRYTIRVRPGLSGTLEYTAITPERIDMDWRVPGFRETGSWRLEPHGTTTTAHHEFGHAGPLAAALRQAFRGVAMIRLQRLAQRVTVDQQPTQAEIHRSL